MGTRLGSDRPKALVDLAGKPLLVWTLERFSPLDLVDGAVVVVPPGRQEEFAGVLDRSFPGFHFSLAPGGAERQVSVAHGLDALAAETDIVVIHDAARPFVTEASIRESIRAAGLHGAATVAIPTVDTILEADDDQHLVDTPDRRNLWQCQTPQTFRVSVIRSAHESARFEDFMGTDDASLVRRLGAKVKLVMGSPLNFKITTPTDLALAEHIAQEGLA